MNWIAEHIVEAAAIGALVFLVSIWLKRASARVRYGLWMVALAKFIVPSALLVLAAREAASLLPLEAAKPVAQSISPMLLRAASGIDFPPLQTASHLGTLLFALWLVGAVWVAAVTILGHCRLRRRLERNSETAPESLRKRIGLPDRIRLLVTPELIEPVQWGIRNPAIALPAAILERLTASELDSILLHELAHVERRDNAAQLFEALLAALFWFHPALWWIERQAGKEREAACDEAVLDSGGDPRIYASAIAKVCEFSWHRPAAGFAGVTGANLTKRMEGIMSRKINRNTRGYRACVALLAASIAGVPLGIGLMGSLPAYAQTREANGIRAKAIGPGGQTVKPSPRVRAILEAIEEKRTSAEGVSIAQKEHNRRIEFANHKFTEGSTPGSETDRGRVYILLGPPDEIDSHPAAKYEGWRYRSIDGGQGLEITFTLHG